MDANSSRSAAISADADVFKAFTRRIMNDNIYISIVKNNSVEIENLPYINIIFNLKYWRIMEKLHWPWIGNAKRQEQADKDIAAVGSLEVDDMHKMEL